MRSVLLCALLLAMAAPVMAQTSTASPHGALKVDCATCHLAESWKPVRIGRGFDHSKWGFELDGAHATASCRACHASLDFAGAKSECASCHADVHRSELGSDCGRCHNTRSFLDRAQMARGHQQTRFPLAGTHRTADCEACHLPAAQGNMQYVGLSTDCVSCHQPDYAAARNPDHVAGGLPQNCEQCHSTSLWNRGFNHDGTAFPLTGAHRATPCTQCHLNAQYTGTPTLCVGCHQDVYDASTTPPHSQVGFNTDCASCHRTTAWDTGFDHNLTAFPLTGMHKTTACAQCHVSNVFRGLPHLCVDCHQTDFDNTTNPGHAAASFPTTCEGCHTTSAWQPATFDHDSRWFPVYSGRHRGQWSSCADCHLSPSDFTQFTCLSCHPHDNKTETDGHHSGVRNYQYVSRECLRCHPRGRAD